MLSVPPRTLSCTAAAYLDIAAFYEHIDVAMVGDDLEALDGDGRAAGHIIDFLTRFQTINHAWGLPQGPDASGILANLYLAPVDSYLAQNSARFLRYSDGIKVFHPDWSELRDLFLGVNSQLRSRRLAISSSRTVILDPQDARATSESTRPLPRPRCSATAFEGETNSAVRRAVLVALYTTGYLTTRYRKEIRASVPGLEWLYSFLATNLTTRQR